MANEAVVNVVGAEAIVGVAVGDGAAKVDMDIDYGETLEEYCWPV